MDESPEKFRVVDKRGSASEELPVNPSTKPVESSVAAEPSPDAQPGQELGEVNFVTFLLSLYSSALAAFGKTPDPATGKEVVHLEAGKQMIDILGILAEKTKGNLSAEESQLLDNILFELRMIYLQQAKTLQL